MGTPKGLLQVLWERGFIDDHKKFSKDGKGVDPAIGVVDLKTSLRYIMSQCPASDQVYTQLFAEILYNNYTSKCLKIQSPTVTIPMFFFGATSINTLQGFIKYTSNSHRRSNVEHTCLFPIFFFFHLPYLQEG
jgi:hypothetical protein